MKHTKGKWDISTHANNNDIVIRSEKGIVANLSINAWTEEGGILRDEQQANAKLIAAAPDMLEALIELFNLLTENEPLWYLVKHYNHAKDAIKKATE